MKREELIDNLAVSAERRETVTLTVRALSGGKVRTEKVGRILVPIADHYTGRCAPQCVFIENGYRVPLVIGLSMIIDFRVGG